MKYSAIWFLNLHLFYFTLVCTDFSTISPLHCKYFNRKTLVIKNICTLDFPDGLVVKTLFPVQVARVQSLVGVVPLATCEIIKKKKNLSLDAEVIQLFALSVYHTLSARLFYICPVNLHWGKLIRKSEQAQRHVNRETLKCHYCCYCYCSVAKSCLTLCDPMDCSKPGFPVLHYLLEFAQIHVHWVGDAIQPSHPLSSPYPPALNLSQHLGLFQWVSSSHQVATGSQSIGASASTGL